MNPPPADGRPDPARETIKPVDDEIDVFGITHPGLVRESNEDHFLIGSLTKRMEVHLTSLSDAAVGQVDRAERLAFLAMVADGVGGTDAGEVASRLAVEAVTRYVSEGVSVYYTEDPTDDRAFVDALKEAALRAHDDLRRAREEEVGRTMATTLSLFIGVWPRAYLVQVGDSRYYQLHDGELIQISRDQTVAQALVDGGALPMEKAEKLPWADVLSSSLGGDESTPVVKAIPQDWNRVHLLCTDGLTKHVPDDRIRERLATMTSAEQVARDLLQDALDDGGTDNVTLIVGRTTPREGRDVGEG